MRNLKVKIIFIALILMNSSCKVSKSKVPIPYDSTYNKYTYVDVVETNLPKVNLYENGKEWLIKSYSNKMIDFDNPNDKIKSKGSFQVLTSFHLGLLGKMYVNVTINFSISLEFREGRYKYTITDIMLSQNSEGTTAEISLENNVESVSSKRFGKKRIKKGASKMYNTIHEEFTSLISQMDKSIQGKKRNQKDDW